MTTIKDVLASVKLSNGTLEGTAEYDAQTRNTYRNAVLLGTVAGLRSMLPVALLAQTSEDKLSTKGGLLSSLLVKRITALAATGEIIGDKLPVIPSRLSTGPFIARLAIGAFVGATVCHRDNQPLFAGIILGAVGAGFGAIAGYSARTFLSQATNIPDPIWAVAEDSTALSLGLYALGRLRFK